VRCCCAVLAQMNQTMLNIKIIMSLTAIDKRLMMKQAANCACTSHAVPMVCLDGDVLMWWRDFGDFHQSQFKTQFWQFSWSNLTKPNQLGMGPIGSLILAMLPILAMISWDLRIDISPKNAENARFRFFAECPSDMEKLLRKLPVVPQVVLVPIRSIIAVLT
jgi:hypothetical protein